MNLKELDSFNLSDAINLHTRLNPSLFDRDGVMWPDVSDALLAIADDFMEHLGVDTVNIKDIVLTGSNAAYTYTPHSDIDLHIIVDIAKLRGDEIYRELFTSKKTVYNDTHDITVKGYDVELYVEDAATPSKSLGEYSIMWGKWNRWPTKRRFALDERSAKSKFTKLVQLAELALRSRSYGAIKNLLDVLRKYRKAGLDRHGEFGPENIAYKALRSVGIVDRLYKHFNNLHSKELSLEDWHPNDTPPGPETKPTMPSGTVRVDVSDVYDWYKLGQHISNLGGLGKHDFGKGPPSAILSFGDEDTEHRYIKDLEATGLTTTDIDPVDPDQPKSMKRQKVDPTYNVNEAFNQPYSLKWEKSHFGDWDALAKLEDGTYLSIMFNNEYKKNWMVEFYRNNSQEVTGEGDAHRIFATVLTAIKQFIIKKKPNSIFFSAVKSDDPTGSRTKLYDRLVQRYASELGYGVQRTEHTGQTAYKLIRTQGVSEGASGYIPSGAERNDPRYKTGLTVDVKPDSIKKNAKKLGLGNIHRSGVPPIAKSNGKI